MPKRSKMGAAGAKILRRRTGGEALAAATTDTPPPSPPRRRGPRLDATGYKVTTIRFQPEQWKWLRQRALVRALQSGATADASEIVRELVATAMTTTKGDAR